MIIELGHFALCLALVVAALQSVVPLVGLNQNSGAMLRFADAAAQIQFLAIAGAFGALTYAYVVSDFSVMNVALNSHTSKPLMYRVSGVWANHEGSMLLWVLILALFGAAIAVFARSIPTPMRATVLSAQAMIGVGFLAFILLTSNPFIRLEAPPLNGQGMNPLLQDPGVALHPPTLYVGYVGFSTAFSFAVAALIRGRVDPSWARWMRPWILIAWSGLTLGIALGSWWAYYELGWGGFWFWDPVENASFMPWLVGTALLHSAIVVEKRDALLKWTILLALLAFALSLMGTFLVRSGVLSSVHAFATDPQRGVFILALLTFYVGGALTLYAWRAPSIRDGGVFAPISRESGLLINNMLLAAACGVVFVGTLYPLALEMATGDKITVGAPYFDKTFGPIFAVTAAVAAIGPFLAWKRADLAGALQRVWFAPMLTLAGLAAIAAMGGWREPAALIGVGVALWLFLATIADLIDRAGFRRGAGPADGALKALAGLPRLRLSTWGLFLGHAGLALTIAGVAGITGWKVESIQVLKPGETADVGAYRYTLEDVQLENGPNYQSSVATVTITKGEAVQAIVQPERRWYPVERQPTTEAGIVTKWHGDFYAVLGDPDGAGGFVTRFYYNPGVVWMWLGSLAMAIGGIVSLADRRLRVGAPQRRMQTSTPAAAPVGAGVTRIASIAIAVALIFAAGSALAVDADEMLADPVKEARAQEIAKQLRCVVCQNQSIMDSNAGIAKDLRVLVRERIEAGDTDAEAIDYIVQAYGDFVLLEPRLSAKTMILWASPFALFLFGFWAMSGLRRGQSAPPQLTPEERVEAQRRLQGDMS